MTINIGTVDKAIRLVLGLILLSILFLADGNAKWLGLIGLVPIITAVVGWCPLYNMLGISTCYLKH